MYTFPNAICYIFQITTAIWFCGVVDILATQYILRDQTLLLCIHSHYIPVNCKRIFVQHVHEYFVDYVTLFLRLIYYCEQSVIEYHIRTVFRVYMGKNCRVIHAVLLKWFIKIFQRSEVDFLLSKETGVSAAAICYCHSWNRLLTTQHEQMIALHALTGWRDRF